MTRRMRTKRQTPKRPVMTRSQVMSRVRDRDTKPEMRVRKALHAAGLRYRLQRKDLPGRPDIVLPSRKTVIFVHGCFWHRHPGCVRCRTPKTRQDFWIPKLEANVERDQKAAAALIEAGWKVRTIWECETERPSTIECFVAEVMATKKMTRKN